MTLNIIGLYHYANYLSFANKPAVLRVIMLNVIILSVIMMNVVAPLMGSDKERGRAQDSLKSDF